MLLQMEHSRRLALTSRTAVARASASSSVARRMWKASRCAVLLPMPGSFFSSSISRAIGSANLDIEKLSNCVVWKLWNWVIEQLFSNYSITNFSITECHNPGRPMLPSIPPMVDCMASSTLWPAPLIAAAIRSCSISRSPDFTASGSILIPNTCLRPSILTVTVPPPEEPSTTVSSIFFCSVSYCRLACDINSCRLNPPIRYVPDFLSGVSYSTAFSSKENPRGYCGFSLAFSFVIDNGANLGAEFFPHAVDYGILLGPAPPASVGRRRMRRSRLRHAPGNDSEPDWPSQHAAGRGGDQA